MLLRRFSDSENRVRVFRPPKPSFVTSVSNIGLKKDFLGKPGIGTADEALTFEENKISDILNTMNNMPLGIVDVDASATLFAHFSMRSRSARTFMGEMGVAAIDVISNRISDGDKFRNMLLNRIREEPTIFIEEIEKAFTQNFGAAAVEIARAKPEYQTLIDHLLQKFEQQIRNGDLSEISNLALGALGLIRPKVDEYVFNAHTKVTRNSPTPKERAKRLLNYYFEVQDSEEEQILSDSVCWGISLEHGITPLHSIEDDHKIILMPISRFRVLVGWQDENRDEVPSDCSKCSASVSDEFFIAHPDFNKLNELEEIFGTNRDATMKSVLSGLNDL